MRTLEMPLGRTVAVPVVNGWVRCPRIVSRRVTVADCAECPRRGRVVTDRRRRTWVHCSG